LLAGVGDVVAVLNEGQEMLGVCNGVNVLAPGKSGMVALDMATAFAAWNI
jgi:phosphoribosylformylglycinamidine (FGAM) synthase-like amidotransferase family enzyme